MFEGHPWRPITVGKMGKCLLSLTEDFHTELIGQVPSFDLNLVEKQTSNEKPEVLDFATCQKSEGVYLGMDSHETPVQPGDCNLLSKHWKSFDVALSTAENMLKNHVTKELKCFGPRSGKCMLGNPACRKLQKLWDAKLKFLDMNLAGILMTPAIAELS